MSEPIKVKGIIIRQVAFGDYDKMLTILTEELGKISVSAKGVRSMKSKNRAATEILCYGEFVLTGPRGEVYSLSGADCIESFFRLRDDYLRLSLAMYMADLAGHLAPEDMKMALKILLNSLYMLGDNEKDIFTLKLIYDLKLLSASGFAPTVDSCVNCGREEGPFSFSATAGGVLCNKCASLQGIALLPYDVIKLLNYILKCPLSTTLYSLKGEESTIKAAVRLTEDFIKIHVAEELKTLEYFKKLVKMQ